MSDNLKQRLQAVMSGEEIQQRVMREVFRDVLDLATKEKCRHHKLEIDKSFRSHMVGCGECVVCVAKEVMK